MRFILSVFFLFISAFSFIAEAQENRCIRVAPGTASTPVYTGRGSGDSCGKVGGGQNLFRSGKCKDGYCPIAFREGACKNKGGVGWIKQSSSFGKSIFAKCIVDASNLMEMNENDPALPGYKAGGNCYEVATTSRLNVRASAAPWGSSCGKLKSGTTVTPAGGCGSFWCPVYYYSANKKCKGIGYVARGRWKSKYIKPCSAEVSNAKTRRDAKISSSSNYGQGTARYTKGGEISSSNRNRTDYSSSYTPAIVSTADFQSSLPFKSRCRSSNCSKSARRGYNINSYNGCVGKITFSTGRRCTSNLYMNQNLKEALTNNLSSCVKSTAKKLGMGDVSSINVQHYGCYHYRTKRGGRSLSEHAKGSAIDISGLKLTFSNGSTKNISMHKRNSRRDGAFYNKLYQCWNTIGGKCSCGLTYNKGSQRVRNLHKDHMHLTYNCRRGSSC